MYSGILSMVMSPEASTRMRSLTFLTASRISPVSSGPTLSAMIMSAPISAAVTASATLSTSTSTLSEKDALATFSIAVLTDPQARMWLSFTRIMESRSALWGSPPATATAFFWSGPKPGTVLRVAATISFPSAASTARAVSVATPLIVMRMLRAVLSAVIMPASGPDTDMMREPALTWSPSLYMDVASAPTMAKTSSASSIPATTASASQVMYAVPSVSGTVRRVVTSPFPTSALRNAPRSMVTRPARTPRRSGGG